MKNKISPIKTIIYRLYELRSKILKKCVCVCSVNGKKKI